MKLHLILFISSFLLFSCDEEMFGSNETNITNDSDWFGNSNSEDKSNLKNEAEVEEKTNAERLLECSVSVFGLDASGIILSEGSGVFIKSNFITTNVHVISESTKIRIRNNNDQKEYYAEVVKVDEQHDIAILKVKYDSKSFIKIKSRFPKVGSDVLVAGNPRGLEGSISDGIVSAIRRIQPFDYDLIQFTAPISFGSSGGPVINSQFELLGITVSGIDCEGCQNLNFAVPSKYIENLLDDKNN